ncbi:hypothetical protein Tco_0384359, partial [Tanacetum coccineum]
NTEAPGIRRTPPGGASAPAGQVSEGLSPTLFNEGLGKAGSKNSPRSPLADDVGGYSSDGTFRSRSRSRSRSA